MTGPSGDRREELVLCDVVRTPFGFGAALKDQGPEDLLEAVLRGLIRRSGLDPRAVDAVIAGCVNQDTRVTNIARIAAMKAGLPEECTDYSVQANCVSGFVALQAAVGEILTGQGELYLACGVESMSRYGVRLRERDGFGGGAREVEELARRSGEELLRSFQPVDCLVEGLTDAENGLSMIEVAEIMANRFGVSRQEQDGYARGKLEQAVRAVEEGLLDGRLVPVNGLERDSYPLNRRRMLRSPDSFSRAAPIFGEDNPQLDPEAFRAKHRRHLQRLGVEAITPTVTMYNSCVPGDGAGGCIVTTETRARELGLKPAARLIGWARAGVDPVIMGIGPVESTAKLFRRPVTGRAAGLAFEDLDVIEIHEAFASQVLSVFRESERRYGLRWDPQKVNVYGGSLAYTHPLAATNFRLLTDVLSRFDQDPSARTALACACAGGGMGLSVLLERCG